MATEHPDAAVVDDLAGLVAAEPKPSRCRPRRHPHPAVQAGARARPAGRRRQTLRARRGRRPPAIDLDERLGLALSVYQSRRWDSDFRTVRALADGGASGGVHPVRVTLRTPPAGPQPPAAAPSWTSPPFSSTRPSSCSDQSHRVRRDPSPRRGRRADDDCCRARPRRRARSHLWGSSVRSAAGPTSGSPAPAPPTSSTASTSRRNPGRRPHPSIRGRTSGTGPQDRWGPRATDRDPRPSRPNAAAGAPTARASPRPAQQRPVPVDPQHARPRRGARRRTDQRNHHTLVDLPSTSSARLPATNPQTSPTLLCAPTP